MYTSTLRWGPEKLTICGSTSREITPKPSRGRMQLNEHEVDFNTNDHRKFYVADEQSQPLHPSVHRAGLQEILTV